MRDCHLILLKNDFCLFNTFLVNCYSCVLYFFYVINSLLKIFHIKPYEDSIVFVFSISSFVGKIIGSVFLIFSALYFDSA